MSARVDNGELLGDRMRRMATFADNVPQHARVQVAVALDSLATLLGRVVAETEDDPTR